MDKILEQWFLERIKNNPPQSKNIDESIIDFKRKQKADIWGEDDKLKPEIREYILDIYNQIFKELGIKKEQVKTIYIIGSITGYYYNDYTDIDIQAVVDVENDDIIDDLNKKVYEKFNVGYVYYKDLKHPFNIYFVKYTDDEHLYPPSIDGVYDVLKNEWITKKQPKIILDKTSYEIARSWLNKIELDVGELKRDLIDFLFLDETLKNIEKVEIKEDALHSAKKMKMKEIIYDLNSIKATMKSLKEWRTECQKQITEEYKDLPDTIKIDFKNIEFFGGIITWKLLDRFGYLKIIGNLRHLLDKFNVKEVSEKDLILKISEILNLKDLFKH